MKMPHPRSWTVWLHLEQRPNNPNGKDQAIDYAPEDNRTMDDHLGSNLKDNQTIGASQIDNPVVEAPQIGDPNVEVPKINDPTIEEPQF